MEAQRCKTCGERHWERVCPNPPTVARTRGLPSFVTKPIARPVTSRNETVTGNAGAVTGPRDVPRSVPASRVKALEAEAEIEMLTAEVAQLKRKLAEAHGGKPLVEPKAKPAPMTPAERVRKLRAKRKAEGALDFKG